MLPSCFHSASFEALSPHLVNAGGLEVPLNKSQGSVCASSPDWKGSRELPHVLMVLWLPSACCKWSSRQLSNELHSEIFGKGFRHFFFFKLWDSRILSDLFSPHVLSCVFTAGQPPPLFAALRIKPWWLLLLNAHFCNLNTPDHKPRAELSAQHPAGPSSGGVLRCRFAVLP